MIVLLSSLLTCVSACDRNAQTRPDRPRLAAGVKLQDVKFYSVALGREMPYRVFFPVDLNAKKKFSVVYLLHGGGGDFHDWSNDSDVAAYARENVILVMPEGHSSYFMNEVEAPQNKYEDFVTKDLIADVEGRFSTRKDRGGRAIIGVSMGGFAAIDYALTRPELFVFAGALSPAIDVPRRRFNMKHAAQWWRFRRIFGPVGSEERRARDPFELALTASPQATPHIFLSAGEQEPLLGPNRRFAAILKGRGFAFEFHTKPGGHDWNEWDAQISDCFSSLFANLAVD